MKFRIFMFVFSVSFLGYAQENRFFSHLNVSVSASTMGFGMELATPLNDYFNLRLGYSGFSKSLDHSDRIDNDELRRILKYSPDAKIDAKASINHGRVLVDFTPVRRGLFHFTAGLFVGETKLRGSGLLINPKNGAPAVNDLPEGESWPSVELEGHNIEIDKDGSISGTLKLGNTIKPYFGMGLGRAVTNNRIGFKFELGVLYQGKYKLSQNGRDINLDASVEKNESSKENTEAVIKALHWWPMINFQLTYRIF